LLLRWILPWWRTQRQLGVYRGLGVREIWAYEDRVISVLELRGDDYVARDGSGVLPALDLAPLAEFVEPGSDQTRQVRDNRAKLRGSA